MTELSGLTLDGLCDRLEMLKLRADAVSEAVSQTREEILSRLDEADATSIHTPGGRLVTRVESNSKKWNITVLRDILEPRGLWEEVRVVREDFDHDRLSLLVDARRISESDLEPAFEVAPRAPYPRVSRTKAKHT